MKFLGIDFGTRKVGLSISDKEGKMAFPYKLLKSDKSKIDDILSIIKKEKIEHIVLGYSVNNQGFENSVMKFVKPFKEELELKLNIPISFEKEFMTSVFARQNFSPKDKLKSRQTKNQNKVDDDVGAAILILQRFLDRK
jgi:putative Holliday junction resolvase